MLDETNRLIAVASMFAMGCCRCSGKAHDGTVACASGWVRKRDEITSEETARPVLRYNGRAVQGGTLPILTGLINPKTANDNTSCVEKVENREAPKISRKSNVGDLSRSKAPAEAIRVSVVAFALVDVVPHIAAREAHERP